MAICSSSWENCFQKDYLIRADLSRISSLLINLILTNLGPWLNLQNPLDITQHDPRNAVSSRAQIWLTLRQRGSDKGDVSVSH